MTRRALAFALGLCAAACERPVSPGDALGGLGPDQLDRFARGKVVFDSVFTPATGLGPLFNSSSCRECHEAPAPGGRGDEVEVHATAFRSGVCHPPVPGGGPVIQPPTTPAPQHGPRIYRRAPPPS